MLEPQKANDRHNLAIKGLWGRNELQYADRFGLRRLLGAKG